MASTDPVTQTNFLKTDGRERRIGQTIIAELLAQFGADGLSAQAFGLVVAVPGPDGRARGFIHNGSWRCYPCSLVKTFHLVHALAALEAGRITPHGEFDRALRAMIKWSSNTGTNYVIDLLTETTGDILLDPAAMAAWITQREGLNRFFAGLGWPEFASCNITQKLMDDTRFGREALYAGTGGVNLNALTPLATARLMWSIWHGGLPLSADAQMRAQQTLIRDPLSPDAADENYQLSEYLCGAMPADVQMWSKAGHNLWTGDPAASWYKHDMARIEGPGRAPLTMVLMTQGKAISAENTDVFPKIGRMIWDMAAEL